MNPNLASLRMSYSNVLYELTWGIGMNHYGCVTQMFCIK